MHLNQRISRLAKESYADGLIIDVGPTAAISAQAAAQDDSIVLKGQAVFCEDCSGRMIR